MTLNVDWKIIYLKCPYSVTTQNVLGNEDKVQRTIVEVYEICIVE